jgi:hypothetical protein
LLNGKEEMSHIGMFKLIEKQMKKSAIIREIELNQFYIDCSINGYKFDLPITVLETGEEMMIGISEQPWGKQLQLGPYDDAIPIQEGMDVTDYLFG